MSRPIIAIITASLAAVATGYLTGEPLLSFIAAGLVAVIAGRPIYSVLAAGVGVCSWYLTGLLLASINASSRIIELLSEIAGLPSVAFYIAPLLIGLLVSMLLAYGLSSIVSKR